MAPRKRCRRKPCGHCGKEFQPTNPKHQWCSDLCRFWANVDVRGPDECWPWKAGCTEAGYGVLNTKNPDAIYAHRFICQMVHGKIRDGHYAIHSCDNPPCCNPSHVRPGTPTDNVIDMYAKGRQGDRNYATGDRHGMRIKLQKRRA